MTVQPSLSLETKERCFQLLLVEDDPDDTLIVRDMLHGFRLDDTPTKLICASKISDALEALSKQSFDAILLDLWLPDRAGVDSFVRINKEAPNSPILVLTSTSDESLAASIVRGGAQDYLIKGRFDGDALQRSIQYAVERHRVLVQLRAMSLVDELTGLYNRQGFLRLAQQQTKMAVRTKRGMILMSVDIDSIGSINDAYGHREGDVALIETASLLRQVFRGSDVIARVGPDEFVVLALETSPVDKELIETRLRTNMETFNAGSKHPYKIGVSIGCHVFDPKHPCTVEDLLALAELDRRNRKQAGGSG